MNLKKWEEKNPWSSPLAILKTFIAQDCKTMTPRIRTSSTGFQPTGLKPGQ